MEYDVSWSAQRAPRLLNLLLDGWRHQGCALNQAFEAILASGQEQRKQLFEAQAILCDWHRQRSQESQSNLSG